VVATCVRADQLDQSLDVPVDPSQPTAFGNGFGKEAAQTFTVGVAGLLSKVDVALYRSSDFSASVDFDIARVSSGVPDFSASGRLATRQISSSIIPVWSAGAPIKQFTELDFSSDHLAVVPGDNLAIILRWGFFGPQFIGWWTNTNGQPSYAGGSYFQYDVVLQTSVDLGQSTLDGQFRTYVNPVPEPHGAFILALGAVLSAPFRCQRRDKLVSIR
jgi:hypothetical protein